MASETTPGLARRAWERWKKAAHAVGVVQTRILMVLIYVAIALPTGLLSRALRDPLHLRARTGGNWTPSRSEKPSLESARRQF
ncbi:MAG: hypothetical protein A3J75_00260 [Acidobacteria bacterium RBG_16_68_9]|nr:MAG: hypothetical protein A3J75_00260 [Acidobacteria bacterium RBG_16_68_9]